VSESDKSEDRRRERRYGLRKLENMQNGFRRTRSEKMEAKADNRDEWTSVVKETKVLRGP
jgi:hypothetical protein